MTIVLFSDRALYLLGYSDPQYTTLLETRGENVSKLEKT